MIDVSGVRKSCEINATNSSLSWSAARSCSFCCCRRRCALSASLRAARSSPRKRSTAPKSPAMRASTRSESSVAQITIATDSTPPPVSRWTSSTVGAVRRAAVSKAIRDQVSRGAVAGKGIRQRDAPGGGGERAGEGRRDGRGGGGIKGGETREKRGEAEGDGGRAGEVEEVRGGRKRRRRFPDVAVEIEDAA